MVRYQDVYMTECLHGVEESVPRSFRVGEVRLQMVYPASVRLQFIQYSAYAIRVRAPGLLSVIGSIVMDEKVRAKDREPIGYREADSGAAAYARNQRNPAFEWLSLHILPIPSQSQLQPKHGQQSGPENQQAHHHRPNRR